MIKLLLKKNKKNALGQYPIYLRVTVNRRSSFTSTKHYILPIYWDAKEERVKDSHDLADEINLDITNKKKQALDTLVGARVAGRQITAARVKEQAVEHDIHSILSLLIKEMGSKRSGATFANWNKHLKKLKEFHPEPLPIDQVTPALLTDFEYYLRNEGVNKREGKDNGNYVYAIMKTVKHIILYGIKRGFTSTNPFKDYEMPEQTTGNKEHLSLSDLTKLEKFMLTTENKQFKEIALYFLFGCYSGLRVSDWYRFDPKKRIHKDYINIRAKKNGQWVSTPLYGRLSKVLELMKKIPLTEPEPVVNKKIKLIAEAAGIDKYLSTHCARKTFAVTLCLDRGISSETAAELMGITLAVFVKSYSKVTIEKIRAETTKAWKGL
jgi:site-specific recombinase XerD